MPRGDSATESSSIQRGLAGVTIFSSARLGQLACTAPHSHTHAAFTKAVMLRVTVWTRAYVDATTW
jgi:hypothetical protein